MTGLGVGGPRRRAAIPESMRRRITADLFGVSWPSRRRAVHQAQRCTMGPQPELARHG